MSILLGALVLYGVGSLNALAQIEIFKYPLLVSKAKGQVFDATGVPIPMAVVTLEQKGRPTVETKTDNLDDSVSKAHQDSTS
jgi:hypothetical protein